MTKNDKRNTILVFVEGTSEIVALSRINEMIESYYPGIDVMFCRREYYTNSIGEEMLFTDTDEEDEEDFSDELAEADDIFEEKIGGDITTGKKIYPKNIEKAITKQVFLPEQSRSKIYAKNILRLIHILDLDGAYLPSEQVIPFSTENEYRSRPFYDAENSVIECKSIIGIQKRNVQKKKNLEYLRKKESIVISSRQVPYSIYYFSSNLDHFIHNNANLDDGDKVRQARSFDEKFKQGGIEAFCEYFESDPDSIGKMGYDASWEFISEGNNSIHRHTNIDLLIKQIREKKL